MCKQDFFMKRFQSYSFQEVLPVFLHVSPHFYIPSHSSDSFIMSLSKKKFVVVRPAVMAQKEFNFVVGSNIFNS